jgi:hypothetical protein
MSARTQFSNTDQSNYDTFNASSYAASSNFFPGEPIGPRRARRGLRKVLNGAVMLAAVSGGWAVMRNPTAFQYAQTATSVITEATSALFAAHPGTPATPLVTAPPPVEPLAANDVVEAPAAAALSAAAPVPEAAPEQTSQDAADTTDADQVPAPLAPPKIDPADPYQKRAVAVGLHPDLSRVLLAKLTPADYKNAGIAIKTALAETPDSDKYVWPKKSKPDLALFEVHFVRGSASDCRRYVVTVTKDGWLTTALPMEKCGATKLRSPTPTKS